MSRKSKQPFRSHVRGPLTGRCNICGDEGPLTEDHTPPKSCGGVTAAHVLAIRDTLNVGRQPPRKGKPQTHVPVRSLCKRCNSDILGHLYDPALAHFCGQVRAAADGVVHLPAELRVRIQPAAVMRSVAGHMAAREPERYDKGALTEPLRDYILNAALPLPSPMKFYYWFYPYRTQVFIRDAAYITMGKTDPFGFWLLKFFPLAFMVTFDTNANANVMQSLEDYRAVSPAAKYDVPVRLSPPVPPLWPEHPTQDSAIMYGSGAHVAESLQRVRR